MDRSSDSQPRDPVGRGRTDRDQGGRDHADVLAVCRWLPQPYPWGAFTGRHDYVHVGGRQGRLNLWWADFCAHVGDYVGPPRGGLVPEPDPDYDVAMPSGGYLHVRDGAIEDWDDLRSTAPVLRADGEVFRAERYGPSYPYWLADYQAMTEDDRLNALAGVRRRRDVTGADTAVEDHGLADAVAGWVAQAQVPDACSCSATDESRPARGMDVPGALLRHGGAVATLTGMGDADHATDVVWSLTHALADPEQAGLVRAAEVAARRAADSVAGWPDGPLTEESVALVAAQALRWHGERIIGRLPFWVMGWIFVASPVLEQLLPTVPSTERNRLRREVLNRADQVRVDRVAQTWAAAHQAGQLLKRYSALVDSPATITAENAVIDLREAPPATVAPVRPEAYQRSVSDMITRIATF